MHDVVVMCVWAAAEPVSSSVHAPQVAWPLLWRRPPSPSRLVGLDGVGVVGVGVAWVRLAWDFMTTGSLVGVCKGYASRGKVLVEIGVGMKPTPSYKLAQLVWSAPRLGLTPSSRRSV